MFAWTILLALCLGVAIGGTAAYFNTVDSERYAHQPYWNVPPTLSAIASGILMFSALMLPAEGEWFLAVAGAGLSYMLFIEIVSVETPA